MSGEADLTNAAQLREVITAQLASGVVYLTIDMAGLSFADSKVIGILAGTAKTLKQLGGGLILLNPQSQLVRVMTILGVDQVLTIRATTDIAPEADGQVEGSTID